MDNLILNEKILLSILQADHRDKDLHSEGKKKVYFLNGNRLLDS